jgi:hypothetical protein
MRKHFAIAFVLSIITIFAIGCGSSETAENSTSLNYFPDGNYSVVVSAKPAAIFGSAFVTELMASLEEEEYNKGLKELEDQYGAKPEDIKEFSIATVINISDMMQGSPGSVLVSGEGKFDADKITELLNKNFKIADLEAVSEDGNDYFSGTAVNGEAFGYAMIDEGFLGGSAEMLVKALALKGGEGESLKDSAEFKEAIALVEKGAQFYAIIPNTGTTLGPVAAMAGAMVQDEKQQEIVAMIPTMKAAAISAVIGKTASLYFSLQMGSDEDAATLAAFANENADEFKKALTDGMGGKGEEKKLDPNSLITDYSVKAAGDTVKLVVKFADAQAFIDAEKNSK